MYVRTYVQATCLSYKNLCVFLIPRLGHLVEEEYLPYKSPVRRSLTGSPGDVPRRKPPVPIYPDHIDSQLQNLSIIDKSHDDGIYVFFPDINYAGSELLMLFF